MAQVDRGFDARKFAGRAVLAAGVAFAGFVGGVRPASAQTIEVGRGQCPDVPAGSLVVGDAQLADGTPFYHSPHSGEKGTLTWMDAAAKVCFPFGGKYRPGATEQYAAEKRQELMTSGCHEQKGCSGIVESRYNGSAGSLPQGAEQRHTSTGVKSGTIVSEAVYDRLIAEGVKDQLTEWCFLDGDAVISVDGKEVYRPDDNPKTGQQTRVHTNRLVEAEMLGGANLECIGYGLDMATYNRRADRNVQLMKGNSSPDGVDVVDLHDDGRVTVTKR